PHEQGGATTSRNLAVLCRRHHRVKTHTDWSYELLSPGMYYWTGPDRVAYLVAPEGTFVLPGVINTPGQPIIKTRRVAIASMRANARAMPTRRHRQARPAAGQPPPGTSPGTSPGTGSGTDPGPDAGFDRDRRVHHERGGRPPVHDVELPVSEAEVPASPATTPRPGNTDPPPF
ncbi:HNH endonuclease, partial [Ruania rhizosphaerae]|uniref:HNH endonuclease n=1 Tax=Ruania rhizosphaerae TaxID=1840413 RepID=UPI001F23342A